MDNRVLVKNTETGHYEFINESELHGNKKKNIGFFLFYFVVTAFVFFFFYSLYLDKYKVYLETTTVYVEQGEYYQVELSPKYIDNFDYSNYKYEVVDESIAKVNDYGEVKTLAKGETTLTVKFKNGIEKEKLSLIVDNIDVKSLEVKDKIEIYKDDTERVKVIVNDQENISARLLYESSDENVFKVDSLGNITGVETGTAILKISSLNGIQTEAVVNVKAIDDNIQQISIIEQDVKLYKNETKKLTLDIIPKRVSSKGVKWRSSNNKIVSVDNNGNIKGLSVGTVIISAKTNLGYETSTVVSVEEASEIILSTYKEELEVGQSVQLKANIDVKYKSSNENVASVDSNGNILAKTEGTAIITATRNNKSNSAIIYVKKSPKTNNGDTQILSMDIKSRESDIEKIELDKTNIDMGVGDSLNLTYTVIPNNILYNEVTWSSDNTKIVSIDQEGNIKALKEGIATVKVTSSNGKESKAIVNVKKASIKATSIKLDKTSVNLKVGDNIHLNATILPSNTDIKTINWDSSDDSVATVNSNGEVIALGAGKTIITAKTNNNLTAKCEIIVSPIEVSKIEITNAKNMYVYDTLILSASITPSNATDKNITWTTSDSSIATIDENGIIVGKKAGEVIITAKSSNNIISKVAIKVLNINPTSIKISESNINLLIGNSKQLGLSFVPINSTNKSVTWTSSDNSIVSVDSKGKITAKKEGTAKITVYLDSDKAIKSEAIVKVTSADYQANSIILNNNSSTLYVDSAIDLKATILPITTADKTVIWSSSDSSIASVDQNGKVTAKKSGKVTITAKTNNNVKTTSEIKVVTPLVSVKKIEIKNNVSTVFVDESITLSATISPITASNKTIIWSSSDNSIATVDQNGKVVGKKSGSVKITATSKSNPKVSGSKSIVVSIKKVEVKSIAFAKANTNLYLGDAYQLTPTFTPKNTTETDIKWISTNPSVAAVDENGVVLTKGVGTADIIAEASNGATAYTSFTIKNNTIKNPLRTKDGGYLYGGDPFVTYDSKRGYYY